MCQILKQCLKRLKQAPFLVLQFYTKFYTSTCQRLRRFLRLDPRDFRLEALVRTRGLGAVKRATVNGPRVAYIRGQTQAFTATKGAIRRAGCSGPRVPILDDSKQPEDQGVIPGG